jgi:uncharacterized repeat protein (TIGR02543 family)
MDEIKWNSRWNSLYRPVVFGCTLSQDGRYVTALTLTEETFLYQEARSGLYDPKREGYTFAGWSATVAGEKKVYTTAELTQLPVGTVLTAEWSEIQTPAPDIPAA